jgi:hypothetical protein
MPIGVSPFVAPPSEGTTVRGPAGGPSIIKAYRRTVERSRS